MLFNNLTNKFKFGLIKKKIANLKFTKVKIKLLNAGFYYLNIKT